MAGPNRLSLVEVTFCDTGLSEIASNWWEWRLCWECCGLFRVSFESSKRYWFHLPSCLKPFEGCVILVSIILPLSVSSTATTTSTTKYLIICVKGLPFFCLFSKSMTFTLLLLVVHNPWLKTKASIEKSKKKKTAPDVFDKDEVMSDGDKTDGGYLKLSKCGVATSDLVDPLLKETYKKLTKLPRQVINNGLKFISWKDNNDQEDDDGNGMILFSSIGGVYPDINLKYIKGLVMFEKDYMSNIVNLSRIDPSLLIAK
ncbi:uncharacterized protein LACBIDRAFT_327421 [Laccaria bicolor S238N-H82]|uniref:Predicted protein n=1 Tax=Laccaria bicolor (strain S238N-H82 / ATCC MYA-4686) TaxID=486041 RepID=B0DB11_LACBS|nr:uncharacterized protein LACBIDRAFT_327421 [Laccaria bicolor S238N-H82]EDR08302.1 predicted protein [Laccaria bicolor S238N-H82]|eukprot:XP_001881372.1 predicted protein [Laccaria bicolor S238N-H82]